MQYAPQRRDRRNLYACSLYDRKGNSSTIALMRSLSIYVCPTAFVRKSSAEIANGVTQGGKREMRGLRFSLGATSSVSYYSYSTRPKSIVRSLRSPVTVARSFHTLQDMDFRSSFTDTCLTKL